MFSSTTCYCLAGLTAAVALIEIALHPAQNIGWCSGLLILALALVAFDRYWRRYERRQDERAGL
jgi:hypothetical protein